MWVGQILNDKYAEAAIGCGGRINGRDDAAKRAYGGARPARELKRRPSLELKADTRAGPDERDVSTIDKDFDRSFDFGWREGRNGLPCRNERRLVARIHAKDDSFSRRANGLRRLP
jgi:hypothetical protein